MFTICSNSFTGYNCWCTENNYHLKFKALYLLSISSGIQNVKDLVPRHHHSFQNIYEQLYL